MSSKNGKLGLASLIGIEAALLWMVLKMGKDVPGLSLCRQLIGDRFGVAKAKLIIKYAREKYASLLAAVQQPGNPVLRKYLVEGILPLFSLYQVYLQLFGANQEAALAEVDVVLRHITLQRSRIVLAPLKYFKDPLRIIRFAVDRMTLAYPLEGWDFQFVENSADRIAFNATRCYFVKTLAELGAPELTASFCAVDDYMAECFPPSVQFTRSRTMGRGDEFCDFGYCRKFPKPRKP